MKIGIVGSGNIGATAARLFVRAGHEVAIANSRGPDSLAGLVRDLDDIVGETTGPDGSRVRATTVGGAAGFGEVVLLALPFRARESLPAAAFDGTLVVDATNPYGPDFEVMDLGDDTSSGIVARHLPGARVVKAFNTMYWETLRDEARPDAPEADRLALFVAGDDPADRAVVADLIRDVGFAPVEAGTLVEGGRRLEPGSPVYNEPLTPAEARERLAGMGADVDAGTAN